MRSLGGLGRGPVTVGPNEARVHIERHSESIGDAVTDALREVEAAAQRPGMPRGVVVSVAAYSTDDREANAERMRAPAGETVAPRSVKPF